MTGESRSENPIEIFQIFPDVLRILVFANLHLITVHEEPMTSLDLMDNF